MDIPTSNLYQEFDNELRNIASWWTDTIWDTETDSIYGEIDHQGKVNENANKGIILYSRALWFFSETAKVTGDTLLKEKADKLYLYINKYFVDHNHGGVFWEIDAKGNVVNTRKQTFAQAFTLYAYSAYYALTNKPEVLSTAQALFTLIEDRTADTENGGHLAAFAENWQPLENMAIDGGDIDAPKTLDTELHILEAYTALYNAAPSQTLSDAIKHSIALFDAYFIDQQSDRLRTHLSKDWQDQSQVMIYGHLFECAWLIWEGVCAVNSENADHNKDQYWQTIITGLIEQGLENADAQHGNIFDNKNLATNRINIQSVWWVQAEALIAYLMQYHLTKQEKFGKAAERLWDWIKTHHIDDKSGEYNEWHAVINPDLQADNVPKAFMWKGPYHNGRAMLKACQYLKRG